MSIRVIPKMTKIWAFSVQETGFPEINIICEKVAFEGVTRFEDRCAHLFVRI